MAQGLGSKDIQLMRLRIKLNKPKKFLLGGIVKILSIEDSAEFQILIQASLGKVYQVEKAASLAEARAKIEAHDFSLILLDVGLPDGDGFVFCTELKNNPRVANLPVVFLTGKTDTMHKVMAFNLGAEDYLVKPFDPLELKARVDVRLKRLQGGSPQKVLPGLKIDFHRSLVEIESERGWEALELTSTEYKILTFLVQNQGAILSRNQIIDHVWGNKVFILDRNVDSHISALRKKMHPHAAYIRAVHGLGYKFSIELSKKKSA